MCFERDLYLLDQHARSQITLGASSDYAFPTAEYVPLGALLTSPSVYKPSFNLQKEGLRHELPQVYKPKRPRKKSHIYEDEEETPRMKTPIMSERTLYQHLAMNDARNQKQELDTPLGVITETDRNLAWTPGGEHLDRVQADQVGSPRAVSPRLKHMASLSSITEGDANREEQLVYHENRTAVPEQ